MVESTGSAVFFEGKWQGKGSVIKDGTDGIPYAETLEFKVLRTEPAIVINVQSFTKHGENGNPMHAENGFIKVLPGEGKRSVEASYSHPFGVNEFEYGSLEGKVLTLEATDESCFQRSQSSSKGDADKRVTGIWRKWTLSDDGKLVYEQHLSVAGKEKKLHLQITLQKVTE